MGHYAASEEVRSRKEEEAKQTRRGRKRKCWVYKYFKKFDRGI